MGDCFFVRLSKMELDRNIQILADILAGPWHKHFDILSQLQCSCLHLPVPADSAAQQEHMQSHPACIPPHPPATSGAPLTAATHAAGNARPPNIGIARNNSISGSERPAPGWPAAFSAHNKTLQSIHAEDII
jgi:hypothetical protein